MKVEALRWGKQLLTSVGALVVPSRLHQAQMVLNYIKLGRWMRDNGFRVNRRVPNRQAVFDQMAAQVADRCVAYLEFGVYQGDSMRYWSKALKHPEASLHGFDSFEGLPEDFDVNGPLHKGSLDVQGCLPEIEDSRVRFFKGWFENTLPEYRVPEHEVLVITLDADLYSSTVCVLRHLRPHIKPGTILYFDDMSRPEHEPRAFHEFMDESGLRFRHLCSDQTLNYSAFVCIDP